MPQSTGELASNWGNIINMRDETKDVTGNEPAEAEPRDSAERCRAIVENQTELICQHLPDGTLTFVNRAFCRYFKKSREELVGHQIALLIPEDIRAEMLTDLASITSDNPVLTKEYKIIAASGEVRWNYWTIRAVLGEDGRVAELLGIGRDISERKEAEEMLVAQRDLGLELSAVSRLDDALAKCLETAIRVSKMECGGVYFVDADTGRMRLVYDIGLSSEFEANVDSFEPGSPQVCAVQKGEPIYKNATNWPPAANARKEGLRALAIVPIRYEGLVIASLHVASRTREEVPHSGRAALETLAERIGSIIVRVRAEEELGKSEARYRALVPALPDMTFRLSRDGVYLEYSMARGWDDVGPQDWLMGQRLHDVLPRDLAQEFMKNIKRALRTGKTSRIEYEIGPTGSRWQREGRIVACGKDEVLLIVRDITESKRAEQATMRAHAELESAYNLQREFLNNITHEVRTPLTAIPGIYLDAYRRPCRTD